MPNKNYFILSGLIYTCTCLMYSCIRILDNWASKEKRGFAIKLRNAAFIYDVFRNFLNGWHCRFLYCCHLFTLRHMPCNFVTLCLIPFHHATCTPLCCLKLNDAPIPHFATCISVALIQRFRRCFFLVFPHYGLNNKTLDLFSLLSR